MFKMVVVSLAFILFTAACTKQREAQFAQGQGENLLEVSAYDGKMFDIVAGNPVDAQKPNATKSTMTSDEFSVVETTITDPLAKKLLGSTPIVGKKGKTYKGLIKLTQNHVKVYKIVDSEKDLPLSEVTYADSKIVSGKLAVPLIGYPVTTKVSIDRAKNEVGEISSNKIEKAQEDISNASHFRMDFSKGEIFEAVVKTDVLRVNYFQGDWYYNETVTSAPEEHSTNLGFQTAVDSNFQPATKIKFLNDEKSLKVVNINVDSRLTKDDTVNYKNVLTIPVDWKAFKVTGNGDGLAEKDDSTIHWSKRPYVSLKLEDSKNPRDSSANQAATRLVNLEIAEKYFSFVLEDPAQNIRIRYSFFRVAPSNYVSKRLYKEDFKLFGFFDTIKAVAQTYENERREDKEKNVLISRFNPNADIVFYFTKTSPAWIRGAVRDAIQEWDKTFAAAGAKSRVVLNETQDVELGDLRYNSINIIETLTGSDLYGFGPSVTDPFTGEIISATTNVHITPIRESIIQELKNYIAMKNGQLASGIMAGVSAQLQELEHTVIQQVAGVSSVVSPTTRDLIGIKMFLADKNDPNKITLQNVDFRKRPKGGSMEFDVAIASGNIHQSIEKECTEVAEYLKEIASQKVTFNERENQVLDSCSRKLVLTKFAGTLIHELGHNFGLRHNFMASNDTKNFLPLAKGEKHQVRSSSVMEYPAFNEDRLTTPGPYDEAAIRYGYADAVLMADGKISKLNPALSIAANVSKIGQGNVETAIHKYKFCTDDDVELSKDPMCQRHDAGETPIEVVKNIIAQYQASYQIRAFRRDAFSAFTPNHLSTVHFNIFFLPLVRFYQEWRQGLARYVGQDDQYLERMTQEQLNATIEKMAQDPQFKEFTKLYKPAADEVFKFLFQIALMDNRYCVLTDATASTVKVEELHKLRENAYFLNKVTINSCEQAQSMNMFENGYNLVKEVGYHLNTFRYNMSAEHSTEPYDVVGTEMDRLNAWVLLTSWRSPMGYDSRVRSFQPSFMDEPKYRDVAKNYAATRLSNGLSGAGIAQYITETDERSQKVKELLQKNWLPKFAQEKDLIATLLPLWKAGIVIPGKKAESLNRLSSLSVVTTSQLTKDLIDQTKAQAALGSGLYVLAVDPSASDSIALINTYNRVKQLKTAVAIEMNNPQVQKLIMDIKTVIPTQEQLLNLTGLELQKQLDEKSDFMEKLSSSAVGQKNLVLFGGVKRLYDIFGSIEATKKENPAEGTRLLNMKLPALSKEIGNNELMFKILSDLDGLIDSMNKTAKNYESNRADIDTQLDLLTSTLLGL